MRQWRPALTFDEARAQFPVLERFAYLNAGTFGPLAARTAEAVAARVQAETAEGRGGQAYYDMTRELRERVRALLGGELGVPPEQVALTYSTSDACNVVLGGLGLGADDEVVTTDSEHFGLLGPLHASGARVRIARVRERPAAEAVDAIVAETGPRTRLVAVSHVLWTTGHVLPIADLAARIDAPLLVDGAQSVGAIAVDPGPADFYTVSGQKWLCGPDSTGALYVADPERLRIARPTYFSQASYSEDGSFTPRAGAPRFDTGWIPSSSLAGLEQALTGRPAWRFERAQELAGHCRHLLAANGFELVTEPGHATLVSFRVEGDAAALTRRAYEQGVVIRDLPGLGWLRASCGYWTNDDDLERLVAALAA
jgi:L-cysteine/cystine lyase